MPYKQQKKLNKTFFTTLIFLSLIFSVVFWPVNGIIKMAASIVFFAIYMYLRRGYMYFTSAAKTIQKTGPSEKVWNTLNKAVKAGVSPEYKNIIALTMIQNYKTDDGIAILQGVIEKNSEQYQTAVAKMYLSMAYFAKKDYAKAIEDLEALIDSGFEENRTFELLARYYLCNNDIAHAKKVIIASRKKEVSTGTMKDDTGLYYIQNGEWKRAREVYEDLLDENPFFPDAYVHAAKVFCHFDDKEKALECLDYALSKRFHSTDIYTEDDILKLKEEISGKTEQTVTEESSVLKEESVLEDSPTSEESASEKKSVSEKE